MCAEPDAYHRAAMESARPKVMVAVKVPVPDEVPAPVKVPVANEVPVPVKGPATDEAGVAETGTGSAECRTAGTESRTAAAESAAAADHGAAAATAARESGTAAAPLCVGRTSARRHHDQACSERQQNFFSLVSSIAFGFPASTRSVAKTTAAESLKAVARAKDAGPTRISDGSFMAS